MLELQALILRARAAHAQCPDLIKTSQEGRAAPYLDTSEESEVLSSNCVCSPSFILSSLGFTAVAFVTGSLALWAPAFLLRSRVVLGETPPCLPGDSCSSSDRYLDGGWDGWPAGGRGWSEKYDSDSDKESLNPNSTGCCPLPEFVSWSGK